MILYTEEGGVTATIWTDVVQMFVYLGGAVVCLIAVARLLPGGSGGRPGQRRLLPASCTCSTSPSILSRPSRSGPVSWAAPS